MRLLDDLSVIASPTDLSTAATCEYALLRDLDGRLGRAEPVAGPADAMLARATALGEAHEQRVLDAYVAELGVAAGPGGSAAASTGTGVLVLERPQGGAEALAAAIQATVAALRAGVDVVAQGAVATAGSPASRTSWSRSPTAPAVTTTSWRTPSSRVAPRYRPCCR